MKKITFLALHLSTGGAEQAISSISNILCENNDVEIISSYKINEKPSFYINPKVKIIYLMGDLKPNGIEFKEALKKKNIFESVKQGIKAVKILYLRKKTMIKAIKKCDSDIIISTRVLFNFWLGRYGKKSSIKIAQEHNHHNNKKKVIKNTVKSLKNIDYFMPVSKELTDFYAQLLRNTKTKCVYIPHSLDIYPEKVSMLDKKNIISVGRLSEEKGFEDLIDVFKLINDSDSTIKLNIVGDGEDRKKIEKKIIEYNLENYVILHGFKNKKELFELYEKSSVYLMTSYTESFGIVLIEAESFGIPVLAFDSAQGAKEIIEDNENGYLIKDRNKELMAQKTLELFKDDDLRGKLGKAGRENSKQYKVENVSKKWNEFIENISINKENI